MPITKQSTVTHTLTRVTVDMLDGYIGAAFTRSLDGVACSVVDMRVEGAAMAALLGRNTTPGTTLANDITDAIYAYALASGVLDGVIT